jgi:hypothetical protein
MSDADQIKPKMPVVCSENGQFAVVDRIQGRDRIRLERDSSGQHHSLPTSWVTRVDDKVHIDRSAARAMQEWRMEDPDGIATSDTETGSSL